MKNCFSCLVLLFLCVTGSTQSASDVYQFKKDWTPTENNKDAAYVMRPYRENDSVYICRYYHKNGPLAKWETYKDSSLEIPNGVFGWYNDKGVIDSIGRIQNYKKAGVWSTFNSDGESIMEKFYKNGRLEKTVNIKAKTVDYYDGHSETLKEYQEKQKADDLAKGKHIKAEFPTGVNGWVKFQENFLKDFSEKYQPKTPEKVFFSFDINEKGVVCNGFILNSVNWSVDSQILNLLRSSPNWKPASINSENVFYHHKQSLVFQTTIE
jgi:hypothetical protein